jgi:translation initiation factor 5A
MYVPVIKRTGYQVLDVTDNGYLNLMDVEGGMKEDVKVPETEIGKKVVVLFEGGKSVNVVVLASMRMEMVVECLEA